MAENNQNNAIKIDSKTNSKRRIRLIFHDLNRPSPVSAIVIDCDKIADLSGLELEGVVDIHENGSKAFYGTNLSLALDSLGHRMHDILQASIVNNDQRQAVTSLISDAMHRSEQDFREATEWCNQSLEGNGVVRSKIANCDCTYETLLGKVAE